MHDRYYSRFLQSEVAPGTPLKPASRPKVTLVLGARQTGKSTLLNHVIGVGDKTLSINLQDRRLRRRYESDDGLLIRELAAASVKVVLIDEIQKVPALLDDIQFLYDQDPKRFQFYLTGSSARRLRHKSANLLPGRVHTHVLSPVLQAEQRECCILPVKMPLGERFSLRSLEDNLIFGSLPGLYQETPSSWAQSQADSPSAAFPDL